MKIVIVLIEYLKIYKSQVRINVNSISMVKS